MEKQMKELPSNKRYKVTKDGKVFDTFRNTFMCEYNNGNGYFAVKLMSENRKRKQHYVHRLVAETYLGYAENLDINHIDGNKSNNCLSNLEIVSHRENMQHAFDKRLLKGFVQKFY